MKKLNSPQRGQGFLCPKRCSLILFILSSIVNLSSIVTHASAQQKQITLNLKDVPLETVFARITRHMGYSFFYNSQLIKPMRADVSVTNADIGQVMDECLKGKPLVYAIDGKTILIKSRPVPRQNTTPKDSLVHFAGRVSNAEGIALPGVSIQSLNSPHSATTDPNGAFDLKAKPGEPLIFSYVGYSPLQVAMREASNMSVTLQKTTSKLDEVQVIGYGTTTKRYNTGSVSTVKAEDIERQPVSNPIAALQGRVPGLVITQTNGLPGAGFTVQIRGQNTIRSGGSQPLFIIDGVPFDANNLMQLTAFVNVNNPLNSLNPSDIESIDVLKDADATSIYGSRGANGVILITTKRTHSGKIAINLGASSGWGRPTRLMKLMSPEEYRDFRREAFSNDGVTPDLGNAYDLLGLDTTIRTDWYQELIGNTARTDNIQLGISGGTVQTRFSAGFNYYRESTVFAGNSYANRKGFNMSVDHKSLDKKFNLVLKTTYSCNNSSLIGEDYTDRTILPPYGFQLKDQQGKLLWNEATINYYGNPLAATYKPYTGITDMFNSAISIDYKPLKVLTLKLDGGYNLLDYNEVSQIPIASLPPEVGKTGSNGFSNRKSRTWSIEPQLQFEHPIGSEGHFTMLLGATWQQIARNSIIVRGSGYRSDALLGSISGAEKVTSTGDYSLYRYSSGFGRLSFDWENTYLLNVSLRRDASSRFGPGRKFGNFGAIGVGWIFSNLALIKDNLSFLSFGKLRASYGTSGNDQIGDYSYLSTYAPLTSSLYQQSLSLFPTRLYNPDYGWEQFRKLESALELGFMQDRLYVSVGWYRNRSVNQLINYSLPGQTGFFYVLRNFPGVVQNKGWELELRSENINSNNWKWSTAINVTIPKNTLISFPGLESSSYSTSYRIGQSLSTLLGYEFRGVDPQTGIYRVIDQNHDGKYDSNDYIICGNSDPKYYGGLQNTLSYKNLSLDFLLQFTNQLGRHPIYAGYINLGGEGNQPIYTQDHWKKPGDIVPYPKLTQQTGTDLYNSAFLAGRSNAALTDASFIRLKNISVSYKIPERWIGHGPVASGSIYVEAQNLVTITNYAGPDPESQLPGKLPPLRMIAAGFKVTF